jgi:FkbM family methyltransferase
MPKIATQLAFWAIRRGAQLPLRYQIEQFEESCAIRSALVSLNVDCVLDVGANDGNFASRLRLMGFKGHIVSFEPNPDAMARLKASRKGDDKFIAYDVALAQTDGEAVFHIPKHDSLGSFLVHRDAAMDKSIPVKMRRLDGLLDEIKQRTGAKRIFLKLDTQGFDLEVVRGAGDRMSEFRGLLSEVSVTPIYDRMPHYTDALREYESHGFGLHSLHAVSRTDRGTPIEYNALLVRDSAGATSPSGE